jgi:uncharacterized protein YwgA
MSVDWLLQILGMTRDELKMEEEFLKRFRVQKAAYLLKYLGVRPFTKYDFSLYIHGPYSPELAREYYLERSEEPQVPAISDDKLELLNWFMNHDERWLEIATSILMIRERYPRISSEEMLSILRLSKPWITREEFEKILSELKSKPHLKL